MAIVDVTIGLSVRTKRQLVLSIMGHWVLCVYETIELVSYETEGVVHYRTTVTVGRTT